MSATARNQVFTAVHTIGGLLPADMLVRIADGKDVSGCKPADYGVIVSRSVRDDAERHWDWLRAAWKELRTKLPAAPEADTPADPTGLARTQWLEHLFAELGFGRLTALGEAGITADDGGKTFPISHRWDRVPVHLAPWNATLDKRPATGGVPPQSLVQECLNRSDAHLWGLLTNGRQLRLLRDSNALATAAYVEFDLEAIFDGELFSEFVLLYRLLHVSRFAVGEGAAPSTCWLEKWRTEAISSGVRALEQLRKGVQEAITTLGTGFLRHPDNQRLREDFDVQAFHNALLRLVYRLLFLFVAEDRDALHPPGTDEETRDRYARYFSSARLRAHARRRRGSAHADLYRSLCVVLDALADVNGRPELGLPGLGGIFDGKLGTIPAATDEDRKDPLYGLSLGNEHLLTAVRHLSQVRDTSTRRWRTVDYRHLGAEELGSVYESLLELVPKHSAVDRAFELVELAGNTRKTTGSYYTPASLIECLLDSALDPVIDDAVKRGEVAATAAGQPDPSDVIVTELLSLTVCDPACGSGHFLVAAARRIAKRVAAVRERNPEPTLDAVRHALHEVIARCIYGVDLNPMAVELAKVSLWLEALEPGKPLSFLDAHIKHGNALIGATPALLKRGIPDEAFKPIEGDDKQHAKGLEKQNTEQRGNQLSFYSSDSAVSTANVVFAQSMRRIIDAPTTDLSSVRGQASAYQSWTEAADYQRACHSADAWCAAFVWHKTPDAPPGVTDGVFRSLQDPVGRAVDVETDAEIVRLREKYNFFHWHLEFPDVFEVSEGGLDVDPATGWAGGFACVLGNPPWERVKLQEQEFFATRVEKIAKATNKAARDKLINGLADSQEEAHRALYAEFVAARRMAEGVSHLLRDSGRYPLAGRGDVNTYAVFAETASFAVASRGRFGLVLPTGIATDATTAHFFSDLVRSGRLASFLDFENEAFILSQAVHHSVRFALLTATGRAERVDRASFAFGTRYIEDLDSRRFTMPPDEILLANPNTGTLPVFRSRRDAEITLGIYRRLPVLIKENDPQGNQWGLSFLRMFDMSNDSHLFRTRMELEADGWTLAGNIFERGQQRMLPLYEAKMLHHFDHRLGTYEGQTEAQANMGTLPRLTREQHDDPEFVPMPRYWVPEFDVPTERRTKKGNLSFELGVRSRLAERGWEHGWLLGWRDIARSTDARTMVATVLPNYGVGHTSPLMFPASAEAGALLQACFSSFVFDYVLRQKIAGTHLTYGYLYQLPVPPIAAFEAFHGGVRWFTDRVAELSYTSMDSASYGKDLQCAGMPFRWDEVRREAMRAELDAALLHLYGVNRNEADYILEAFPVVRRSDEAKHGTYRTKVLILDVYDRMASARAAGSDCATSLRPPPGQGARHQPHC
ncbi:Eco57I restriction-modification methylase domain-containing protein [Micromonospora sp. NPDC018662]|uniref:Eco57I restriction-modification methylase domain-containing protein n=1 Tax=Micromonospora sp. NPDC018662 TaxID=3364238 RepID=UPI00379F12FA